MAADFLCQGLKLRGKDGVAVLCHKGVQVFAFIDFFKLKVFVVNVSGVLRPKANLAHGVFGGIAVCAHKLVHAVIRAGSHDVVLNEDALALCGADHGHGFVAVLEIRAGLAGELLYVLRAVEGIRVHGHKRGEAVSAVDVEGLCNGAESVGGIEVSPVLLVELQTPVAPVLAPVGVKVVVVGAFNVDDVPENALLRHCKGGEFKEVVAAVLKDHAVLAGALGGVHKVPAGLKGFGRRNLQGNVLAMLHGVKGHGNVVDPVRADIHKVYVWVFAELLVHFLVAGIYLCAHAAALKDLEVLFGAVRLYVADGGNVAAGNI